MKVDDPIISIVVPTKNRYIYLKELVNLIENFADKRIELIIQDNSDCNKEILEFLSSKKLISTKYFYDNSKLSMSSNADLSIRNSTGKYVCFIGDDDGVCRNIADCAEWMEKNNIEALRSLEIQFFWNDHIARQSMFYYDAIKNSYKYFNPINELNIVLLNGISGFGNIPKLYHGIVRKEILNKIYAIGNTCFPGGSPDISISIALCFYVTKYVIVNVPVVFPGMSKMVAGGVNNKVLELNKVQFISEKTLLNWETKIPRIWANELIWPESAIKSLKYINKEEYVKKINYNKLLSRFAIFNTKHIGLAFSYSNSKLAFLTTLSFTFLKISIRFLINRCLLFPLTGKINGRFTIKKNIKSIQMGEQYLFNIGALIPFDLLINK